MSFIHAAIMCMHFYERQSFHYLEGVSKKHLIMSFNIIGYPSSLEFDRSVTWDLTATYP